MIDFQKYTNSFQNHVNMILDPTRHQLAEECEYTCPVEFWAAHISSEEYENNEIYTEWQDPATIEMDRCWRSIAEFLIIASETLNEE